MDMFRITRKSDRKGNIAYYIDNAIRKSINAIPERDCALRMEALENENAVIVNRCGFGMLWRPLTQREDDRWSGRGFFRVKKNYFADGKSCDVVITGAIRRSANTMTHLEIDAIFYSWEDEGCRIINNSNYRVPLPRELISYLINEYT